MIGLNSQYGKIKKYYNDVFKGLDTLQDEYHIKVNRDAVLVKHAPRQVPIPLRNKLADKLVKLETKRIVKNESDLTGRISSMVLIKRNEKMCICLDPEELNAVLKRSHYQIPTIDEILRNLAKANIFSSLGPKDGYWQILLDEESSKLTTFGSLMAGTGDYDYLLG